MASGFVVVRLDCADRSTKHIHGRLRQPADGDAMGRVLSVAPGQWWASHHILLVARLETDLAQGLFRGF
jgi:hypothetical protein